MSRYKDKDIDEEEDEQDEESEDEEETDFEVKEEIKAKPSKEKGSKDKSVRFELVKVPTQTELFIQDHKNNTLLDDKTVLLEILNKLDRLERILT